MLNAEGRSQKSEVRRISKAGSRKPEAGSRKLEAAKLEAAKLGTLMPNGLSRRQLFRMASTLGAGSFVSARCAAAPLNAAATPAVPMDPDVYKTIGVRPLINCRGTFTIIGGSVELPEVRAAKSVANQRYVQLDELMDAIGKRLGELTGAEWGMVSAGCAAAMSHATAACVAGGNPDLHVRIPNLTGFEKDEVIIPAQSRNVYDAAIRAVGVRIIEVETPEALELAIGPRTAMIYIFATTATDSGPMSTEAICRVAKARGVPVLVDAAAEILTIPNVHLQRGATLVAYSGGKYIRGPQSAGLLLGRKDLVQAAWVHSAPHHGYARSMKVGREEMIGMLVAVESWVKRDHDAEWKEWVGRCQHIAARVSKVQGVTATVQQEPDEGLSNRSPSLRVRWTSSALGITGQEVAETLYNTEPRITLNAMRGPGQGQEGAGDTGISIVPSMMAAGDEQVVAQRLFDVLSAGHTPQPPETAAAPAANISGRWDVDIQYAASRTTHAVYIRQDGNRLEGTHQGNFLTRNLSGTIAGDAVTFGSNVTERHGDSLNYRFAGKMNGDTMSGTLDMGEYRAATWTARRASSGRGA
jgi:L-seryl-tRNA(Ser) seleniumtransferase